MTEKITNIAWANADKTLLDFVWNDVRQNAHIDEKDIPGMSEVVADILAGVYGSIAPYVEPKQPVPQVISMRQCRLQLLELGMLDDVDAAIQSMPSPAKEQAEVEWEYATEVKRTSALVLNLGGALGLSSDDMDELFKSAAKL